MSGFHSALYRGTVRHTRLRPVHHDFKYRVYYGLWDIDELDRLDRSLRLFSLDRFNLFSIDRRDHGAEDGTSLRAWVVKILARAGVELNGGRIDLLAYPRVLGYVFNPISVWYCYDLENRLMAVVHEVRNTFGDKHSYVVPIDGRDLSHEFEKHLHVSPFNDMDSNYSFSMTRPGEHLSLGISQGDDNGHFLRAGLSLTRIPLTDLNLMRLFWSHPLLTLKVVGGIHWEAVRLWFKGARFHRRPMPPLDSVTVVDTFRSVR
ncbi:MAG TPA: DUF1365 domain-containing protein [Acidimicrobiia bacterium]